MTKNMSTPRNPPWGQPKMWSATTVRTAKARSPSMSGLNPVFFDAAGLAMERRRLLLGLRVRKLVPDVTVLSAHFGCSCEVKG